MRKLTVRIETEKALGEFLGFFDVEYSTLVKAIHVPISLNQPSEVKYKKPTKPKRHKDSYYMAMEHWVSMPEFIQPRKHPLATIEINIGEHLIPDLIDKIDQKITDKTKSFRYPYRPHRREERFYYE